MRTTSCYDRQVFRFLKWVVLLLGLWLQQMQALAQEAICAEVKIVIEQKLSLERQAFDAHMIITNGLETSALQNVSIKLYYLDQNNQPVVATTDPNAVGASFFYRTDTMTGIASIDGNGSIAPKTKGDIHWMIIPAPGAGGTDSKGKVYYVGAKVSYTLNGKQSEVDVTPDYIVVKPQPMLKLDYFLPTDVYGDDAFTPETEPSIPFTLGVRIKNIGAGTAYKTSIESAQPKIVENKQGLLISFEILGGYVSDLIAGKSLLLNFGDIAPNTAKMGRWNMITSLYGKFVEFDATYTHADNLGGAVTSLLKEVVTHTLVHDVKVDAAGRDNIRDFLAKDGDTLRVYESDNIDTVVADRSKDARLQASAGGYSLTFPATPGFVYVSVPDPMTGKQAVGQVQRSDGKVLPTENVWLYKTRDTNLNWHYFVGFFDVDSTGQYNFKLTDSPLATLNGVVYNDKNANGLRDAQEEGLGVVPITLTGEDVGGVSVSVKAYTDTQGAFSFTQINPGTYNLVVSPQDGFIDGAALAGTAQGLASPGSIKGITLGAGAKAEGYLFAKRTGSVVTGKAADLGITLSSNVAKLKAGDSVTFTINATNVGPDAAEAATVTALLPTGFTEQSAQASVGNYSNGSWSIGALAKGQTATLTLTAKVGTLASPVTYTARIGSSVTDPVLSNNAATVVLQAAGSGQITITQTLSSTLKWLILASCPDVQGQTEAACASEQASAVTSLLKDKGYEALGTTQGAEFIAALRTGKYNALWVHAGTNKLSALALEELRAAVRRQALLVLDGTPDTSTNNLDSLWGGTFAPDAGDHNLGVTLSTARTAFKTEGSNIVLQRAHAQEEARYTVSQASAIASARYGEGHALVMGFDALQTLKEPDALAILWPYLQARFDALAPVQTSDVLARSYASILTELNNQSSTAASIKASMTLPSDMKHEVSTPSPDSNGAQVLNWNITLPSSGSKKIETGVRMPSASGSIVLSTQAINSADNSVVGSAQQNFKVLGADVLIPRIQTAMSALNANDPIDQTHLLAAKAAIEAASTAFAKHDNAATLSHLAQAEIALRALTKTQAESVRQDIARWFALAESEDQGSGNVGPVALELVSGSSQTAVLGENFGAALQVKVLDAQNRGVAGVTVSFIAPPTGPSASFSNQSNRFTAITNEQGVASAGVLKANQLSGSYLIQATAAGVSGEVQFSLTNKAKNIIATRVERLAGDGQSAMVGTAFAGPLQVKVLDQNGQALPGVSVTFTLPTNGASATFAGGLSSVLVQSNVDGIASAPVLKANSVVGTFIVTVSAEGVSQSENFTLSNTSTPVDALTLSIVGAQSQETTVNSAFAAPLQVKVTDAQNQPKVGALVRFTLPTSGAGAAFTGGLTTIEVQTDIKGVAQVSLAANGTAGSYTAVATLTGQSVSFALTNVAAPVEALTLTALGGSGQNALINRAFASPLEVKVVNTQNQPKAGVLVRFTLPTAGVGAVFTGGVTEIEVQTDANGIARVPLTANGLVGHYTATATLAGKSVSFTLSNSAKTFSANTTTGTGGVTATISGGGDSCAFNPDATHLLPPPSQSNLTNKLFFPHGLFEYELVGCKPGSQITITTTWPDLKGVTGYMKYGPTPLLGANIKTWYIPNNLRISGNTTTYTIKDGELGDDDLKVNGVIRDPGGPVLASFADIPVLNDWMRLLLILILGAGTSVYFVRRQASCAK